MNLRRDNILERPVGLSKIKSIDNESQRQCGHDRRYLPSSSADAVLKGLEAEFFGANEATDKEDEQRGHSKQLREHLCPRYR